MHRILTVSISALVGLVAAAIVVGPVGAARKPHCALPDDGRVVAESADAVVYRTGKAATAYRACFRPTGRRSRLSKLRGPLHVDAISGRYVAFRFTDPHYTRDDAAFAYVRILDLRRGRLVQDAGAYPGQAATLPAASVSRVQLLSDGTAAWIVRATSRPGQPYLVVSTELGDRRYRVLDEGPDIDPASLALTDAYVYWTRAGSAAGGPRPD